MTTTQAPTTAAATPWPGLNAGLAQADPEVAAQIANELHRQQSTLEMIASENFASVAAMEAQGSVLTNKYAEGYPGRRYYGGCEFVDVIEKLAIERIKTLFGAGFANVQPHSGAQANAAAMQALIKPGDTILGLSLAHGGHLTHGMRINFSGLLYNVAAYEVSKEDHRVDMDEVAPSGASAPAEADHRRLVGLPPSARFRPVPRDRRRGRRLPDGRHGPLRRPGRHRPAPVAGPVRARHHHHHPQDAGRPARRCHPDQRRRSGQEDQLRRLPRPAGRPAGARHRGEGGRVQDGRRPGLQGAGRADRPRRRPPREAPGRGRRHRRRRDGADRRYRRAPGAGRPAQLRPGRQVRRGPSALGRHHRQPQRRPVRPAAADGDLGVCASAHRHSPPAASATRTSPRWPTSSRPP